MIIVYVTRIGGQNADVSYNTAWEGLWAFAEISFGIIVTCTFTLPKFFEANGTKLRSVLSSIIRPFTSLTSGGSFGSKKDTIASRDVELDKVNMIGQSDSELAFANRDHDVERQPSHENTHKISDHPGVT